jgi:hypothetical protein
MVGLPETGKTTFLAALYHVVEAGTVPAALQLASVPAKRDYLNQIRRTWSSCLAQEHTRAGSRFDVRLSLRDPITNAIAEVVFPDVYGELFNEQYAHREWAQEYDDLVSSSVGMLLFLHPAKIRPPATIRERLDLQQELAGSAQPGPPSVVDRGANSGPTFRAEAPTILPAQSYSDWTPELAPTQVELVELLQFIRVRRRDVNVLPLAAVVSAWDLVPEPAPSVEKWVAQQLPLLSQYLVANADAYRTAYYGVSAQGGDLHRDLGELQNRIEPTERIIIVGEGCVAHDLTAPVRWLMN